MERKVDPRLDDSTDQILQMGAKGLRGLWVRHKMAIVSGIFSFIVGAATLLVGIGRFEANAQAQSQSLQELKSGQDALRKDVEARHASERQELLDRLDRLADKQDNTRQEIKDLAVEVASLKATVRLIRHESVTDVGSHTTIK